jgi:hypothetical protein
MRNTIRQYLGEAVNSYEDKPREQWLFDFPAQVSLCGSQVWWTAEVAAAFTRLEEGYENALKDYQRKQVASNHVTNFCNRRKSLISGVAIKHADFAAARRADETAEAENHDSGHHRRARA